MHKTKLQTRRDLTKSGRAIGTFDRLEERALLTPIPLLGTQFRLALTTAGAAAIDQFRSDGFLSVRLISTQPGRIETDPTGAFGSDLFVVSRGTVVGTGGIFPTEVNSDDAAGIIYRVDPYAIDGFGMSPADNRIKFASIPGGGVSFGGYEDWFDIAFDPTDNFSGVNGGPTLYVSTLDSSTTPDINPKNAIYGFLPDGSFATPAAVNNPNHVSVFSAGDVIHPGLLDSQIAAIAIAPGDTFARDLYVFDTACDNETNITCAAGDGNTLFRVIKADVPAAKLTNPAQDPLNPNDDFLKSAVDLDKLPSQRIAPHVEGVLPPLTPVPPNNDVDVRAMVFDPNRGIILQGRNGEPAFPLYGGMFLASSDIEVPFGGTGDTGVTRVLHFPSLGFAPIDMIAPAPIQTRMIGDMTFDPIGHFGGGLFFTDYITRSVFRIVQDPMTGLGILSTPIISNFNVLTPTQFTPAQPPGITPADAYRDAFSISFSADGGTLFVSDRDGVWAFYAETLAQSAAGTAFGLTDLRQLHVPYTGQGYAAAIVDTGVDAAHLGFQNTVSGGFNPAFPSTGNFDACPVPAQGTQPFEPCHGTAMGGIVHQIVPDAIIVPVNPLGFSTTGSGTNQDFWEAIKFVADHPFVDDPRTAGINESVNDSATPQDDRTKIVAVNMSLGIIQSPTGTGGATFDTEREAFNANLSAVIPFNAVFDRYRELGIVPVGAAGNDSAVSGSAIPAVLNAVVETIAAYPFGVSPLLPPPPVTVITNAAAGLRCTLGANDLIAFPGKIPAFTNRSRTSDFAAPGLCVPTFARSLFLTGTTPAAQAVSMAPLMENLQGTSAANAIVSGAFVLGFDTISHWAAVAAASGSISPTDSSATTADDKTAALNQYLTRGLLDLTNFQIDPTTLSIGTTASHLGAYLNPDGINAILQWTAIPREDKNIGESDAVPLGTDDNVQQRRLLNASRYRDYAHLDVANFVTAVEGSVALKFFETRSTEFAQLDTAAGTPGLITAEDIDAYVADTSNTATERAMARLFGGSDRIARLNRVTYLDLVQNERVDGGILTDAASMAALRARILPLPTDFVIINRHASQDRTFALDSTAPRNYHDLRYVPRTSSLAPKVSKKLRKRSPDQLHTGFGGRGILSSVGEPAAGPVRTLAGGVDLVASSAAVVNEATGRGTPTNSGTHEYGHVGHRAVHSDIVDRVLAGFLPDDLARWLGAGV